MTPITYYGITLARSVPLPNKTIPRAEQILKKILANKIPDRCTANIERLQNPINRTITLTANNLSGDSAQMIDFDRNLYDLYANIMDILYNQDIEQIAIKVKEQMVSFKEYPSHKKYFTNDYSKSISSAPTSNINQNLGIVKKSIGNDQFDQTSNTVYKSFTNISILSIENTQESQINNSRQSRRTSCEEQVDLYANNQIICRTPDRNSSSSNLTIPQNIEQTKNKRNDKIIEKRLPTPVNIQRSFTGKTIKAKCSSTITSLSMTSVTSTDSSYDTYKSYHQLSSTYVTQENLESSSTSTISNLKSIDSRRSLRTDTPNRQHTLETHSTKSSQISDFISIPQCPRAPILHNCQRTTHTSRDSQSIDLTESSDYRNTNIFEQHGHTGTLVKRVKRPHPKRSTERTITYRKRNIDLSSSSRNTNARMNFNCSSISKFSNL